MAEDNEKLTPEEKLLKVIQGNKETGPGKDSVPVPQVSAQKPPKVPVPLAAPVPSAPPPPVVPEMKAKAVPPPVKPVTPEVKPPAKPITPARPADGTVGGPARPADGTVGGPAPKAPAAKAPAVAPVPPSPPKVAAEAPKKPALKPTAAQPAGAKPAATASMKSVKPEMTGKPARPAAAVGGPARPPATVGGPVHPATAGGHARPAVIGATPPPAKKAAAPVAPALSIRKKKKYTSPISIVNRALAASILLVIGLAGLEIWANVTAYQDLERGKVLAEPGQAPEFTTGAAEDIEEVRLTKILDDFRKKIIFGVAGEKGEDPPENEKVITTRVVETPLAAYVKENLKLLGMSRQPGEPPEAILMDKKEKRMQIVRPGARIMVAGHDVSIQEIGNNFVILSDGRTRLEVK